MFFLQTMLYVLVCHVKKAIKMPQIPPELYAALLAVLCTFEVISKYKYLLLAGCFPLYEISIFKGNFV